MEFKGNWLDLSTAIAFLGLSAALFGHWLENAGPRRAMFYSAVCFSTGFFVSALGAHLHSLWLTGLAIMGFGGGAMIGGPLANNLMTFFKAQGQTAPIPATFLVMGALYFVFMMHGVFTIRVPMQTTLQPAAVVQPEVTTLETPKN